MSKKVLVRLTAIICVCAVVVALAMAAQAVRARAGYVLKRNEGEGLPAMGTIIKASPLTGSQQMEVFLSALPVGFATGTHVHHEADELFFIVKGTGTAQLSGKEISIQSGDVIFIPKGEDHRVQVTGTEPMETLYLVDRPGLASEFREAHALAKAGKFNLSVEEVNKISRKFGTTYKTAK
jgi:mannose-6-phosphate isomerase-like protein (cupin superfamily)